MERLTNAIKATLENPDAQQPTLRKELEQLKRKNEELGEQVRRHEEQKRAILSEIAEREKESREVAQRASEEVQELGFAMEEARRVESDLRQAARKYELSEREEEARHLANLADAEVATRKESQAKALADLDHERSESIRKNEYRKLEQLLELFPASPAGDERQSISLPTTDTDHRRDYTLRDRSEKDTEARRIASEVLRPRTANEFRVLPDIAGRTNDPLTPPKRVSRQRARQFASRLSTIEPTLDVALAIHYATQIERQQGNRYPLWLDIPVPPPGQYQDFLSVRPRVVTWFIERGRGRICRATYCRG